VPEATSLNEDEQRLAELGYKQELSRSWSGFSNFAISFSIISIPGGLLHELRAGLEQRWTGGDRVGLADHLGLHPGDRLLHVRAGLGVPHLGRHLLVGVETRRGEGRLLHRLAQPHRPLGHRGLRRVRLRDVPRPDPRHLRLRLDLRRPRHDLPVLPRDPDHRRCDQHLLQPPPRCDQQHLRVVARDRGGGRRVDPAADPGQAREPGLGLHPHRQQHRVLRRRDRRRGVPLRRAAAVVHPHPVHDHRLRRVRAPVGRDQERRERRRQGHLAVDRLLRASVAGSCCCRSSSPSRTRTRSRRAAAGSR
jgi:hypothetical protein